MAIKSKIRLPQLSGSIKDVAYSGSLATAAVQSQNVTASNLVEVLAEFAGAIGRISGKQGVSTDSFTNQTGGKIESAGDYTVAAGLDLVLSASGGDFFFKDDGATGMSIDIDATVGDAVFRDAGNAEVFRIMGADESVKMSLDSKLKFRDAGLYMHSTADGLLGISADGAAANALVISASNAAGGIDIDAGTGGIAIDTSGPSAWTTTGSTGSITLDAGAAGLTLTGSKGVGIKSSNASAQSVQIQASNAAGGIKLDAGSTGISIGATGAVTINSSASTIGIGNNDDDFNIGIGTQGDRQIAIGGAAASGATVAAGTAEIILEKDSIAGRLALSGAAGGLEMSGSAIYWSAGATMTGDRFRLANDAQWSTFSGNSLFGAGTTLVGALNALASAAGGGVIAYGIITGSSIPSGQNVAINANYFTGSAGFTVPVSFIQGEVNPANTEVYVNGQLLVSQSDAQVSATGDYEAIMGPGASANTGLLKFNFNLLSGDVIQVKTSAQQS